MDFESHLTSRVYPSLSHQKGGVCMNARLQLQFIFLQTQ